MKKFTGWLLAALMSALLLQVASAESQKTAVLPFPSVDDFTRGNDGFSFGLGLGVEYESAYEGSDEFGFEANPAGAVQWRRGKDIFYFAGEALGWRSIRADAWFFDVAVAFDEGREESDSDDGRLDGLGDSEEGTEVVLQVRRALDANWRYWLDGRVVTGDNGTLGLFGAGRRFGDRDDGTGSELSVVAVYHDADRANANFGVTTAQSAASGLQATNLSGGFRSIGLNYTYRQFINQNWQIFGEALYEHFGSDVTRSPIARADYEAEVGIGFIYIF
jgi:outer membrane scaffolding protein for murein synthesis (MipA/OmpV family)